MNRLHLLYEDNHLLVVDKPAGLATMGTAGAPSLHSLACDYLRQKYQKPGGVYVGVVSRLDTVTSGVIVLARTSKAAARLSAQFADHAGGGATKIYLAVVEGAVSQAEGELTHFVRKDDAAHRMRAAENRTEGAKLASLRFSVLWQGHRETLVAVRLLTGRKHQIRVQFSAVGHPVLGDRKYGSNRKFATEGTGTPGVALHSWRLQIKHPTRQEPVAFGAQPPRLWRQMLPAATIPLDASPELAQTLLLPPLEPLPSRTLGE